MDPGWFPDPTGRYPARYHDGADWSDQVQGTDGQVAVDVLHRTSTGLPAPGPAVGAHATGPDGGRAQAPTTSHGSAAKPAAPNQVWAGLGVAGFGVLLALLSLFALDWVDGGYTFSDLSDGAGDTFPDEAPLADMLSYTYLKGLGILGLVVVVGGVVWAAAVRARSGVWVTAAVFAAGAAVVHMAVVSRLFRGDGDPELGAHLGTLGYLVVVAGLAVGSTSKERAA